MSYNFSVFLLRYTSAFMSALSRAVLRIRSAIPDLTFRTMQVSGAQNSGGR